MMTIKKSSQWKRLWALAAVPVVALALLAFANPKTEEEPELVVVAYQPTEEAPSDAVQPSQPEVAPVEVEKTVDEQTPEPQAARKDIVFESVEQMPQYPGGEMAMMKFLAESIHYPVNAVKNKVEGRVIVQFVVEKTGEIGEVKVVRSVDEELDAEAVRVVKELPKFTPGRVNGKAVAVWYTLPITFKLQGDPEIPKAE